MPFLSGRDGKDRVQVIDDERRHELWMGGRIGSRNARWETTIKGSLDERMFIVF